MRKLNNILSKYVINPTFIIILGQAFYIYFVYVVELHILIYYTMVLYTVIVLVIYLEEKSRSKNDIFYVYYALWVIYFWALFYPDVSLLKCLGSIVLVFLYTTLISYFMK